MAENAPNTRGTRASRCHARRRSSFVPLEPGDFGREITTLSGHTNSVLALAIYDSKLYSGSVDKTIKVWSLEAGDFGREITTLSGHTYSVRALAIQESKLYSGS